MKTRIHCDNLEEFMIECEYPEGFAVNSSRIIERTYSKVDLLGEGSFTEMFFGGIHIGYGDLSLYNDTQLFIENDIESVEMHFTLSGDTFTRNDYSGTEFVLGCNQHNIFYNNGFRGISDWSCNAKIQVFEVNLLPSFFQKYLPDNSRAFENFKKNIIDQKAASLSLHNLRITPKMFLTIREILGSKRQGFFERMFIEAKVIELLMLQLEQILAHDCDVFCSLKKSEIDKMYQAKEILINNIASSCTLIDLAQKVGTNEFTLKKGFKEVFGTTVFGFWNDLKMHEARKLIVENAMKVSEVSEMVGYKYPQHFSTAFKKYFGVSPGKLSG